MLKLRVKELCSLFSKGHTYKKNMCLFSFPFERIEGVLSETLLVRVIQNTSESYY